AAAPVGVLRIIGPVALVGDVEGEEGIVAGGEVFPQALLQVGEVDVIVGHVLPLLNELLIVVFGEEVIVQAQVGVDVDAVVVPPQAGVGAVGGVPLALEIPGHGVGVVGEVPVAVAPGEDGPLGLGGAP